MGVPDAATLHEYVVGALWMLVSGSSDNSKRFDAVAGVAHTRDVLSVETTSLLAVQHLLVGTLWSAIQANVSQRRGCAASHCGIVAWSYAVRVPVDGCDVECCSVSVPTVSKPLAVTLLFCIAHHVKGVCSLCMRLPDRRLSMHRCWRMILRYSIMLASVRRRMAHH